MIAFLLNLPYTITGLLVGVLSLPKSIQFEKNPYAFVLRIKKFWWRFGYLKYARAMTIGHVVLLGPEITDKDFEHEMIHVEQYQREPIIYPLFYYNELIRKGVRNNKYEDEAYVKAGNKYREYK